ncbi:MULTISPECIES: hypothetical protein [unclassified Leucobacter]|uniref:hypothetical protein n=1 Tax=unclassified Leucobacter TaxID=2621730 RepID=UPI0030181A5C
MLFPLEDKKIEFGCEALDLVCMTFENQARGLADFMSWLATMMIGDQKFEPGTKLWTNAIDEAGNWMGFAIVVMIAIGSIGVATGMLQTSGRKLWWSILGVCSAIPSTYFAVALGGELLRISDLASKGILDRIGGVNGFMALFRAAAQGGTGNDAAGMGLSLISGGVSSSLPTMTMLVMLIIGLVLMGFALAFRNLALMILIAFAPLAFMAVGTKGGWKLAKLWALSGLAMLLAKPLMLGILAMLLKTSKGAALFSAETMTVATGLFVVSFMPLAAGSFFAFLGQGNEAHAGGNLGQQAGQKVTQSLKQGGQNLKQGFGGFGGGGKTGGGAPGGKGAAGGKGTGGKPGGSSGGPSGQKGTTGGSGGPGAGRKGASGQQGTGGKGRPGDVPSQPNKTPGGGGQAGTATKPRAPKTGPRF